MDKVRLSPVDSREIRELLRRLSRWELVAIARDYVGWALSKRLPCPITTDDIEDMTDENLRKFIFERDWPGHRWVTKGGKVDAGRT